SQLAFHSVTRAGMWKRVPDRTLVNGWIDQALELAEPGSAAQVRALVARVFLDPETVGEFADEAVALADALGDPELRSHAWSARAHVSFRQRRFGEVLPWAERRFDLAEEIGDPDHVVEMLENAMPAAAVLGRFD